MRRIEAWIHPSGWQYIASTTELPIPGCNKCGRVQPYDRWTWIWWSAKGDHILCDTCYATVDDSQEEYTRVRKTTRIA